MQDTMKRKYACDRSITVTRLEDLVQDAAVGLFTVIMLIKILLVFGVTWKNTLFTGKLYNIC